MERAAELIEIHGHYKGGFGDASVGFCATGAMRHAAFDRCHNYATVTIFCNASEALQQYLLRTKHDFAVSASHIPHWNDMPERTAEEVIETMRQAAKDLRNEA